MRIALFQGPEGPGDVAANLEALDARAAEAGRRGAQLLICPEMFLSGYNIGAEAAARLSEPADGPSVARACALARRHGVALLFGYPERGPSGVVYNAARLIGADGRPLANYRKRHLFGDLDRRMFRADDGQLSVVPLGELRVGILICYDVEFPESVRMLALQGVDLVAVPTALMTPFEVAARLLVPARAVENQVFVAYANRCGREGELTYCGLSCVTGPDGADLARAGTGEGLLVADLDLDHLRASRAQYPYLVDRRPELYAPLCAVSRGRSEAL
jgi:predicted amidohydrolase